MVQVYHDNEEEAPYAICGTMLIELEVQRTNKRTELWACTLVLAGLIGPLTITTDNMGIVDGLWRREEGCSGPTQKDADLWRHIWGLLTQCAERDWKLNVKHVKAYRTKKKKEAMAKEQSFVMRGNEKAGELAKEGTVVDGRQMATAEALTSKQRKDIHLRF